MSTAQQEDGTSLETQAAACQRIAELDGQPVMAEFVFREQASAADTDRWLLTDLRRLVREGKITKIYVYSPDRLSRNPFDLMTLTEEFSSAGVELLFVQGPSGDAPEDKLVRYILGYVGEKERAQITERTNRGKVATARQGRMPTGTGKGLYGYNYQKETKRRTVSEFESYCKKIKENLTSLDHDGKRSAFAVLNVSAVATHDQVVVKEIVPSDITTIEQTSA